MRIRLERPIGPILVHPKHGGRPDGVVPAAVEVPSIVGAVDTLLPRGRGGVDRRRGGAHDELGEDVGGCEVHADADEAAVADLTDVEVLERRRIGSCGLERDILSGLWA